MARVHPDLKSPAGYPARTISPLSVIENPQGGSAGVLFSPGSVAAMLFVLHGRLAYRQLFRSGDYENRKRLQNQPPGAWSRDRGGHLTT